MALPWLRILETAIGFVDLARSRRARSAPESLPASSSVEGLESTSRALGGLETRLAGVVVAALKEAFDRDTRRLELEREQLEAERRRAERALKLELLRQAVDREVGRLRLLAGVAVTAWIGTLFFSSRLVSGPFRARVTLGAGWVLLLGAIAAAFAAQSAVGGALREDSDQLPSTFSGAITPWLIVAGLALVGLAALM